MCEFQVLIWRLQLNRMTCSEIKCICLLLNHGVIILPAKCTHVLSRLVTLVFFSLQCNNSRVSWFEILFSPSSFCHPPKSKLGDLTSASGLVTFSRMSLACWKCLLAAMYKSAERGGGLYFFRSDISCA